MIAFRIRFNNRKLATAGLPGHHVVSAIATSAARRPEVVRNARPRKIKPRDLKFELGGLWHGARRGAGERVMDQHPDPRTWGQDFHRGCGHGQDRPAAVPIENGCSVAEVAEKTQLRQLTKKYSKKKASAATRHNKALQPDGASRRR